MIGFMITVVVTMISVASYGFGWCHRGRYESPYIKQMRDALKVASGVFDGEADKYAYSATGEGEVRNAANNRRLARAMHDATLRPWG